MKSRQLKWITGLFLLVTAIWATGCFDKKTEEGHEKASVEVHGHEEEGHEKKLVRISDEEMKEFGVELATAGPGRLTQHVDVTGEIVVDPTRLAHIVPRFSGIVKDVKKQIGDKVKKGEVLAIIESNESLTPYKVKSLIDGTVIDMHLAGGELISDESHAFTVADLSVVWAQLDIYQKDLGRVKVGQNVIISALAGTIKAKGTISYISPIVDEETRTVAARVVMNNSGGIWKPGLFINGKIQVSDVVVPIRVPKTALQTIENETVIFIKKDDGFYPQPVKIGKENSHAVEIISGLREGDIYVAHGGFTLKSELSKEAFGGHGH
ncbi:MAG: efflux RND transporter periplasmic adaptor subunit [Calditrichia bacterium]